MRVLVTGATGFIGSHATAELIRAGHDVRLLVRSPEKVPPTFERLGVTPPTDLVPGDITDEGSVAAACDGCDAVLHAASVFAFGPRAARTVRETNFAGLRTILDAAIAAGHDPIVHVSSYGAIVPAAGGHLTPDSPPSTGEGPYSASKADQERLARDYQAQGRAVVTIMPGSVWGPDDPYIGESHQLATDILAGRHRMLPRRGAVPIMDVRDLATATARIFEPGRGPRRYLMAGHPTAVGSLADLIGDLTGRKRRYIPIPIVAARQGGMAFELAARVAPWRFPLTRESARIGTEQIVSVDDSRAAADLGWSPRPLAETVADTIRWLATNGRIPTRWAGRLAEEATAPATA